MGKLFLVESSVLPEVFARVVEAKRLLTEGLAENASQAARMSGISRSAFYKYKDSVFPYSEQAQGRIITAQVLLRDRPGVLSSLITELYRLGANILTINPAIPSGGTAAVSVSLRTDAAGSEIDGLLDRLRTLDGVQSVTRLHGGAPEGESP